MAIVPTELRNAAMAALSMLFACAIPTAAHALSLDFPSIFFRTGQPSAGQSLAGALDSPVQKQIDNLALHIEIMQRFPHLRYQIIGLASPDECGGTDCAALSLRRAQLVHAHFLEHGIPAGQLNPPIGIGLSELPLGQPDELTRRRVDFRIAADPPPSG